MTIPRDPEAPGEPDRPPGGGGLPGSGPPDAGRASDAEGADGSASHASPAGSADGARGMDKDEKDKDEAGDGAGRRQLTRSPRGKLVGGVCAGLGRYCDVDPVIFRIVIGVLGVAGGLGLIFYGFAWLLIPLEGEEENEGRRMLSGRVEGSALIAVLFALVGCGLFLSMLGNGGTLSFAVMLACAAVASAVWSKHRRETGKGGPSDPAGAHGVSDAPPETKAPPVPGGSPSWWRDPLARDGAGGHRAATYLWGPAEEPPARRGATRGRDLHRAWAAAWGRSAAAGADTAGPGAGAAAPPWAEATAGWHEPRQQQDIGGAIFLVALIAGALCAYLAWDTHPFAGALQIALVAVVAVLGLGLVVTSFLGRAAFGTVVLTVIATLLLAAATALPDDATAHWSTQTWRPTSAAAVQGAYRLGTGVGTLDLRGLAIPAGTTLRTTAHVGGGRLKVLVPAGTALDVRASTTAGAVRLPGDAPDELHIAPDQHLHRTYPPLPGPAAGGRQDSGPARQWTRPPVLALTLDVGLGEVEVTRAAS
ncbi:PspC domain-containing protein [Streptomyces sp. NPDC047002]|uniref:PspC domain-containing protein n=1 Tax=Streptomyces sp. NPDC047002 TaxID=3155475 RepID=UPI00345396EC